MQKTGHRPVSPAAGPVGAPPRTGSSAQPPLYQRVLAAKAREQALIDQLNRARAAEDAAQRASTRRFAATIFCVALLAIAAITALIGGAK